MKEHPDYKYRPRRKPKSLLKKDKYAFPIPMIPGMSPAFSHHGFLPPGYPGSFAISGSTSAAETLAAAANEKARAFLPPSMSLHPHFESMSAASKLSEATAAALRAGEFSSAAGAFYSPYAAAAAASAAALSGLPPAAHSHSPGSLHGQYMVPYCPPGYGMPSAAQDPLHRPLTYVPVLLKPEDHYRPHVPSVPGM